MASDAENKQENVSFKETLNLPQTDFPIRPDAAQDDPALIERWKQDRLYDKAYNLNAGAEKFVIQDGPPYANGNIHLGHAYNKVLKDMIAKSHRMSGQNVPMLPVWDCHGLPIEIKVMQTMPAGASRLEIKKACREYAAGWVKIQAEEFTRLGTVLKWSDPHTTMSFDYEASIVTTFGKFVERGYIQRKLKTVPWCPSCQTVLASAEIEYEDRKDPSIYVTFALTDASQQKLFPELAGKKVSLLVWTTTPWTLPLNRAVLAHPDAEYLVVESRGEVILVGAAVAQAIFAGAEREYTIVKTIRADQLKGLMAVHPFDDAREVPLLYESWVGLTEGTAFVHCAPGCGPQDYEVGVRNGLEIFSPVGIDGAYTQQVGIAPLIGMKVADAQGWVITKLLDEQKLFLKQSIKHSYPHCWRCHNGLIFRATRQWFCNLEHGNLRERALAAIEKIRFFPPQSKNYLKATVSNRLEWCLSRQRVWGVPIPALLCASCDEAVIDQGLIAKIADGIKQGGVEFWDRVPVDQLIDAGTICLSCGHSEFVKEEDILDVWFDAGVGHTAILKPQGQYPAQMYIEGLDQHRGWFQSALLTSLVLYEDPAMESILTHGFTVDQKGHKMSKSRGNVVAPSDMINKYGTDVLRLWVASIDYSGDAIVSDDLLKHVAEVYRKIRNTCRFMLLNLYDFNPETDTVPFEKMPLIDQYALSVCARINETIQAAYDNADCTAVFHELADYASVELSQFYFAIVRDRLYVEKADGNLRRSTQTAALVILDTLTKLMAPVLSFTAELVSDAYDKNKTQSIHLQSFNTLPYAQKEHAYWKLLRSIRSAVLKSVEQQRELGIVKDALEARITIATQWQPEEQQLWDSFLQDLEATGQSLDLFFKEFLITSQVAFADQAAQLPTSSLKGLSVLVEKARGTKCPRCWQYDESTHKNGLCSRCEAILG